MVGRGTSSIALGQVRRNHLRFGNLNIVSWEDTSAVGSDAAALKPAVLTLLCHSVDVALLQLQLISLASPVRVKRHIKGCCINLGSGGRYRCSRGRRLYRRPKARGANGFWWGGDFCRRLLQTAGALWYQAIAVTVGVAHGAAWAGIFFSGTYDFDRVPLRGGRRSRGAGVLGGAHSSKAVPLLPLVPLAWPPQERGYS